MKHAFSWGVVLLLVVGAALWAAAQPPVPMGRGGGMMGGEMMGHGVMGANPPSSRAAGGAASTYSGLCESCHGTNGNGNGPAAAALNPKPKDFADCKAMAKISDATLFKAIHGGGRSVGLSPMMPPWGGSLTEQQIHGLVGYIRSFCKT